MLTFKFLNIVISLLSEVSVKNFVLKCDQWTKIVNTKRPVHLIVDIGVLSMNWSDHSYQQTKSELEMAGFALPTHLKDGGLQIESPAALPRYGGNKESLSYINIEYKASPCIKSSTGVILFEFFQRSNVSKACGSVLHACRTDKPDHNGVYHLTKETLHLTRGVTVFDISEVKECINANANFIGMEVRGFKERGFCLCDAFERVLIECGSLKKGKFNENILICVAIGIYAVLTIASVALYLYFRSS
jgi:hypothetical protein